MIVHDLIRVRMLAIFKWVNVLWSVSKAALVRINNLYYVLYIVNGINRASF